MHTSLRIKKCYFDAIKNNVKKTELRSNTDFYRKRLLDKKITSLMLHYQTEDRIYCDVVSIKIIATPTHAKHVVTTKDCIELTLKNIRDSK